MELHWGISEGPASGGRPCSNSNMGGETKGCGRQYTITRGKKIASVCDRSYNSRVKPGNESNEKKGKGKKTNTK